MRKPSVPFFAAIGILVGVLFAALIAPHHFSGSGGDAPAAPAPVRSTAP